MKKITVSQRIISSMVIFAMIINPAIAAQQTVPQLNNANRIVVDEAADRALQAGLKKAANGTTVVDIAAPSAAGVSHNRFTEFNVDQQGVILNNSLAPVLTQLGGWADGNRRLAGGDASIILNEVTGLSRSHLLGQLEIAGKSAEFVLANPNGISCNGCGFINTPRVTMVTGRPDIVNGSLRGFNVSSGDFTLDGKGLNASNIDRFDIVTRAAKINAELYARKLNIYTGSNYFDYQAGQISALDNPSSKPEFQFALDASSLGAMYANSIQLIGTEKGLGVNSQGLIQSTADLEISVDGEIRLKQALANNRADITTHSNSITVSETLYASKLSLTADQNIVNNGLLASSQSLELNAQNLVQTGNLYAGLTATGQLSSEGTLHANLANSLTNSGSIFVGADLDLSTHHLDNSEGTLTLQSATHLNVPGELKNHKGSIHFNASSATLSANLIDNNNGNIFLTGNGQLYINAIRRINNSGGVVSSGAELKLTANEITNHEGTLVSDVVTLKASDIDNRKGIIDAQQLSAQTNNLLNTGGQLAAHGKKGQLLSLTVAQTIDNNDGKIYSGSEFLSLTAQNIFNRNGSIFVASGGALNLAATNALDNTKGSLYGEKVNLSADTFINDTGTTIAGKLDIASRVTTNNKGRLQSEAISLTADTYLSEGGILFAYGNQNNALQLDVTSRLENIAEAIIESRSGDLTINSGIVENRGGLINLFSDGTLHINAESFSNLGGQIQADENLMVSGKNVNNNEGLLVAENISITSPLIQNSHGQIVSNNLTLSAPHVDNRDGKIISTENLSLQINRLDNQSGLIQTSSQNFTLHASEVNNSAGQIMHSGNGIFDLIASQFFNNQGAITGNGALVLATDSLHNNQGHINAQHTLDIDTDILDNTEGVLLSSERTNIAANNLINKAGHIQSQQLNLNGHSLDNTGGTLASTNGGPLTLDIVNAVINRQGTIISDGNLLLRSKSLDNDDGIVDSATLKLNLEKLSNRKGIIQSSELSLAIPELNNAGGMIAALQQNGSGLQLHVNGLINNEGGTLLNKGQTFSLNAANINNRQGQILNTGSSALLLNAGALSNASGTIKSNTDISININGNTALNNEKGFISSAGNLNITTANALNNFTGNLLAGNTLSIASNHISNADGLISAHSLILRAPVIDNTGKGVIEGNNVALHGSQLNNSGSLLAAGSGTNSLVLDLAALNNSGRVETYGHDFFLNNIALHSEAGEIIHHGEGELRIHTDGIFDNRQGTLATQGNFVFDAEAIDNRAGQLIAAKQLDINIAAINNEGGLLQSGNGLSLSLDEFNNSYGGRVVIGGSSDASIHVKNSLNNQQGSIVYKGSNLLTLVADNVDNSHQGIIGGSGAIALNIAQHLNNNDGNIIGGSDLNISTHQLDNRDGGFIEAGSLLLTANQFDNHSSLLQAQQFSINVDTLNNAANGTLLALGQQISEIKAQTLHNVGDILANQNLLLQTTLFDNDGGRIESEKLTLKADIFDNSGLIRAGELSAQTQTLANRSSGKIDAGQIALHSNSIDNLGLIMAGGATQAGLNIYADIFNNSGRLESHGQNLELHILNQLTNSGVTLHRGDGVLSVQVAALDNSNGAIVGNTVALDATSVNNNAGEIYGQTLLTVNAQTLDNRAGLLQADKTLTINATTLDNSAQGVLLSGSETNLNLDSLDNRHGVIASGKLNVNTKTVDNRNGEIIVEQLALLADDLNNSAGTIAATAVNTDSLALNIVNQLKNNEGLIYAKGTGAIIHAGQLNNTAGTIEYSGSGTLHIETTQLNNTADATISSNHDLLLDAETLVNNDGNLLANNNLNVTANAITNHGGSLMAGQSLSVSANSFSNDQSNATIDWLGLVSGNWIELAIKELHNRAGGRIEANSLKVTSEAVDNQGLLLAASTDGESLQLTTNALRNSGQIKSYGEQLNFNNMTLDNSGGNIVHFGNGNLNFTLNELLNNGGLIDAAAALTVNTTTLHNNSGVVIARGEQQADIKAITMNNNGGLLRANNLLLVANTLDNTLGEISGDQMNLTATQLTNAGGWIVGDKLQINAGQLNNIQHSNAQAYISGQHVSIDAQTLHNQSIIQAEKIHLSGDALDNTEGLILSTATEGESLTFDFTQGVINNHGHIESRGDSLLMNSALDNREGLVFMAGNGTLSLQQVDNTEGQLLSNGHLAITTNTGNSFVKNQLGVIQALQNTTLIAADIDNSSGHIKAGAALAITAHNIDNSKGLLLSTGTADNSLQLTIGNQLVNAQGIIETHADNVSLSTQNINNRNGKIRHIGVGVLSINSDEDFVNDGGTLLTTGDMSIAVGGTLTNDGNLVAARKINLDATAVKNLSGSLLDATTININSTTTENRGRIQADTIRFNGDSLDNRAGQLSVRSNSNNALQFNLLSVDNSATGLIENHGGNLLLDLAFNNQGGKLLNLGEGVVRLTAVDNMGGQIYSAGDLAIEQHTLNNSNGGLLQSAGQLSVNTQALNNRSGTLYTNDALTITTESLDNTKGGELLATNAFDVTANQTLDNTEGRMVALADTMRINSGMLLNNFGELIHEGNGNLILTGGGTLNNNAGRISTQGSLSLLLDSLLNNAALNYKGETETALIAARNFSLIATELQNNGGQIQASEQLSLTLPNINNQGGKILALGAGENALILQTSGFNNSQGGLLQVHTNNLNLSNLTFNNQGGVVNHQGNGNLIIAGQQNLQNAGGVLQSIGNIQISQMDIDNRGGLIYGQQVDLTATHLLNNSAGGKVAGDTLSVVADRVNNTANGLLAGLGNSANAFTFNTNVLDNSGGTLRSGANTWSLNLDAIINNGGSILHTGNNQLTLTSNNSLITSGTIASTADLVISTNSLTNQGVLVADRNINLTGTSGITNTATGVIKGGEGLSLKSNGSLSNRGQITSGSTLAIQLGGLFDNTGLLITNATNTTITSTGLTNSGTLAHNGSGLLALNTGNITNTGTLKSAGTLNLGATTINNSAIISAARLNASSFNHINNNANARIEAGNISLQGDSLINQGTFVVSDTNNSFGLTVNTLNNSGTLTSNSTDLSLTGSVTNSGTLTHSGNGILSLGNSGAVDIQGGKISTAGTANLSGSISGVGDLFARSGINIGGTGTFNNNGSKLYTQGNLDIKSAVNNTQNGSMIADGALTVTTSGAINNTSGYLQGMGIELSAGTLINTNGGQIVSTGTGIGSITAATINNSNGLIQTTNNSFTVTATQGDIDNTDGKIHQKNTGALNLNASKDLINKGTAEIVTDGTLTVNATEKISNQGKIQAGNFVINTEAFTNSGSVLGTNATDSNIQVATLTNTGSIEDAGGNLSIIATLLLNNTDGKIKHAGSGVLSLNAPSLLNVSSASTINSNGIIRLITQGHFTNGGEISSGSLTEIKNLNALTNNGTIASRDGTVEIGVTGALTNTHSISGKTRVDLSATTLVNTGELQSDDTVKLTMKALDAIGKINAGKLLDINVLDSINIGAGEAISTAGSLSLVTQGDVTNAGTIAAANTLALGGRSLTNNGNIEGGTTDTSSLNFSAGIINNKKISSSNNLTINGSSYTNNGSTAAAGNLVLKIKGDITNNNNNVFFSGGGMTLGANGSISNNGGTIFSIGNMTLAGENGSSANTAVVNTNGRIESLGEMTIHTGSLNNIRTGVSYVAGAPTSTTDTTPLVTVWTGAITTPERPNEQVAGYQEKQYRTETTTTLYSPTATGPDAMIVSGGDMAINAYSGLILNQYGTIASGNNLTVNGGDLRIEAFQTEAHDVITTTRIDRWRKDQTYYCPNAQCVYYYDEGVENSTRYVGPAIGTISAVGSISGNLKEKFTASIVSADPGSLNQNTNNSGNGGSANRGTGATTGTGNNVTINNNNGQAQNTNGQSRNHNGNENGSNATANGLTTINLGQAQAATALSLNANIDGTTHEGSEQWQSVDAVAHGLATGNDLTEAYLLQLANANNTAAETLSLREHSGTHYDTEAARQQAEANASADKGSTAAGALSGAQPTSSQKTLPGLDNSLLELAGQFQSQGVTNVSANGSTTNANILVVKEAEHVATQTPANSSTAPVAINTALPSPFAVGVTPGNIDPKNLGGLFVYNTAPNSKYLIETRPEFTDYTKFLGSDYLLKALGYDPDKTLKRLGDAFYENQLIRDALRNRANTRFLGNATSDEAQMKQLMDNAVDASKALQLRVGIALTPAQVAALTQDILWLVEQEVNGQKVLVPQLYLASVDKNKLLPDGSLIAAGNMINLTADKGISIEGTVSAGNLVQLTTAGDFTQNGKLFSFGNVVLEADGAFTNTGSIQGDKVGITAGSNLDNTGTLRADSGLWLTAGDTLTNQSSGQIISGSVLSLLSTNDLINKQGHLEGVDVFLKSTTGNIVNRTDVDVQGCTNVAGAGCAGATNKVTPRYGTDTLIGNSSTLISHNSLTMDAGNNLDLQGSKLSAANNISLTAGNDILLNALENTHSSSVMNGKTLINQSTTTWDGVSINAGNNLALNAGRDIQAPGAQLTAGGNANLTAGRDINLLALANTNSLEMTAKRKSVIDTEVVHTLASVTAGGNATATAGQDLNLIGAAVSAGGNVSLAATRDTNISAVLDSDYHYDYTKTKKSFGRSKTTENETLTQTVTGGTVQAGGNILVNSHIDSTGKLVTDESGKVNILGGMFNAGGSVVIAADDDINISGIAYDELDFHRSAKSGLGGLSKKDKGAVETNTKLQNAMINAGGNAFLLSGNNLTLAATNVVVDGNINLEAVDKLLITAGDVVSNSERWSKSSGIGNGGNLYGSKEHKSGESVTSGQASTLSAGGKITGRVGSGDIIGSDLTGTQGVEIVSDMGDINVGASRTTTNSYSYDKSMSVGLGDLLSSLSRPDQLIKTEDGRATVKLANAQYDQVDTKTTTTEMRGSTITSNGDVSLIAKAGSVTITGSTLTADADNNGNGTLGLAGATGVVIQEATDTYDTQTKEVHGSAELSIVVQHQAVEVAKAVVAVDEAKDKLEQAKKDYKAYERNVSQLEDQLSQLESDYANKVPGVNYGDLLELRSLVSDIKDDKEWYQAGVALAAVNLTSSVTALAQQTAAAAQSAGTWGFNAGIQLDIDASKSNTAEKGTTAVASELSGNKIVIQTGTANDDGTLNTKGTTTTISGSHLNATDRISIQTGDLNLLASKDTRESKNEQEHGHITAQMTVYGASGGASVNGSFDRSKNSETSTAYNNTTLNANNIDLFTSGDANIRGANVHANEHLEADIQGDLNLESVQNRSNSRNTSMGVSGGVSFGGTEASGKKTNTDGSANHNQGLSDVGSMSGINGGINSSNGMSVTRETVLTSLTSGGTANVNVKGNTQITGALLGTIDQDGNDLNQLNFSTGTLNFTDLRNSNVSNQTSAGISANFSIGSSNKNPRDGQTTAEGANGNTLYANTSNLTYSNSQQNSASKTLATLGHGNITVGGTQLEKDGELTDAGKANGSPLIGMNRDTSNTEKTLWNSEQSQTIDVTLDHRLLSSDGRTEIQQQLGAMPQNIQIIAQNVPGETGGNSFENAVGKALNTLSDWTGGILPSDATYGGLLAQLPSLLGADDNKARAVQIRDANDPYVLAHPELFVDATTLSYVDALEAPGKKQLEGKVVTKEAIYITKDNATYQNHVNGILNSIPQALVNGMEQTRATTVTEFYNPTHGLLGDLLESAVDKFWGNKYIQSGVAAQTGTFVENVIIARGSDQATNIVGHSQGTELLNAGLSTLSKNDFKGITYEDTNKIPTFFINGAAVNAGTIKDNVKNLNFNFAGSNANKNDPVAEFIGRNQGLYIPSLGIGSIEPMPLLKSLGSGIKNISKVFDDKYPNYGESGIQINNTSTHSTYSCIINCGNESIESKTNKNNSKDEEKK